MKNGMLALIRKDLHEITSNKRMFSSLLIVPLVLTTFLPTVFVLILRFAPSESEDMQKLLKLLPSCQETMDLEQAVLGILFQSVFPVFFLLIPLMAATIMAASAFVGEKEKHTLETLLYCPLSLKQIFRAKVMASFVLSMAVSLLSFAFMLAVFETELFLLWGRPMAPGLNWILILFLISPAISLIAITLIVRISAKSQNSQDAQQTATFLLFPILALLFSQFSGFLLVNAWLLFGIGIACALLAAFLLRHALGNIRYDRFLN